jgi:hypothetical protein
MANFVKIGTLFKDSNEIFPIFSAFYSLWIKSDTRNVYKNFLSDCEFRTNQHSESHISNGLKYISTLTSHIYFPVSVNLVWDLHITLLDIGKSSENLCMDDCTFLLV